MELSQIVSYTDSKPIQMLSRADLWRLADQHGITYPRDATKDHMILLFESANIDVTRPENGIDWVPINGKDEHGHPTQFLAPIRKEHQSAREHIDSDAILQNKLSATEDKNDAQSGEIKRLREENTGLKEALSRIGDRLDALDARNGLGPKRVVNHGRRGETLVRYRELRALAKKQGFDLPTKISTVELEKLLGITDGG